MSQHIREGLAKRAAARAALTATLACGVSGAPAEEHDWHVSVGPGIVFAPEYPGAKDEEVLPIPALDIRYRSLFLDWRRGLGGYLLNDERRQIGASVWLRRGRDGDADSAVSALEDIDDSAVAQLFFNRTFGPMMLGATLSQAITGNTGLTGELNAAWQVRFSQATRGAFGVQAVFGNDRYMRTWFGITPDQARPTGPHEFSADGGLRSVGGFASFNHTLSPRWTLAAFAGLDVLVDDAADSPVAERNGLPTVGLGAFYHFDP
jgi:outer membrane protein